MAITVKHSKVSAVADGPDTGLVRPSDWNADHTFTGTLDVANGGTGATTASAALTNLGAYPATNPSGYTTNTGTVTSVGGTGTVSGLSLSGTVTTTGNLTLGGTLAVTPANFASQTAATVLAAPNAAAGVPSFRALVAADIPTLNQNTTGTAANVTGTVAIANGGTGQTTVVAAFDALAPTTTSGDTIYHNGTDNVRLAGNTTTAKQFLSQTGTGTVSAAPAWSAVTKSDVGLANVENTALSTWAGSANITTVGTVATGNVTNLTGGNTTTLLGSVPYQSGTNLTTMLGPNTTTTKKFLRQTGTGTNGAAPAWDTVTATDVGLGNVTNNAQVTSVTGTSPVASSGGTTPAIRLASGYGDTQNPYASKTANYVLAAPNGAAGVPTFRAIVAADIPTLNQSTTGTAANVTGTVAVANGGTGATTAAGALTNLGAAPLASPTFTGTPAAPTATAGTNTTQLATTAFVTAAVAAGSGGFPTGTLMLFQQTAAPTGWTKQTTHNDKALRVVSGTASSGGSVAFSTAFASQSVSGSIANTTATGSIAVSGGAVAATTLSTTQIPSHTHQATGQLGVVGGGTGGSNGGLAYDPVLYNGYNYYNPMASTGGGTSHTHSFTQPSATFTGTAHNHTFTGTAINLAVSYVDLIIASKN